MASCYIATSSILVNSTVLQKHAGKMRLVGSSLVWALRTPRRFSLTPESRQALRYASGLKGGVYRNTADDLSNILRADAAEVTEADRLIMERVRERFAPLSTLPGIVYAIELIESEVAQLSVEGNIVYAPFDVPPDRITFGMIVPHNFEDR